MDYDTRDQETIWRHQADRRRQKRAEDKARGPIIAAFKCPVCGGRVIAHGFKWMCERKCCSFAIGRAYKSDPHGHLVSQKKLDEYDAEARARYQEEQRNPQPVIDKLSAILEEPGRGLSEKDAAWIRQRIAELRGGAA